LQTVLDTLAGVLKESWAILNESSYYVLFGLLAAALLRALVPDELVVRHLGGNRVSSVVKAALFGIPIPLCSCGVVPTAMSLRRQGAGRGATTAFLISTPETGVDSIAITYALMDPLMTLFRPIAAFLTAVFAGLLENGLARGENPGGEPAVDLSCPVCGEEKLHDHPAHSLRERVISGLRYTFGEFLADIGKWLVVGFLVAGAIGYLLPDDFLARHLGGGVTPMLAMLIAGIPLYVCATSSTPVAAALVAKGLSPGAALVFLLAGPATNAATMMVVARFMGRRSLGVYLVAIAASAVALGYALDFLYPAMGMEMAPVIGSVGHRTAGWSGYLAGGILLVLIARSIWLERSRAGCE
jgi:hypothetical protein